MSKLINKEALRQSLIKVKQYIDDKLFGNSESLKDLISEEISKGLSTIVDSAPEAFDTLKEVADWIAQDETHSAIIIESINKNTQSINEIKNIKADSTLSTESENPVMNKVITEELNKKASNDIVEEISSNISNIQSTLSSKADTNGTYPEMSVGIAEDLMGRPFTVDSAFTFRPTAGAENEIKDDYARIESIKGNSVVWNQMRIDGTSNNVQFGLTIQRKNESFVFSGTFTPTSSDKNMYTTLVNDRAINGHRYFVDFQSSGTILLLVYGFTNALSFSKPTFITATSTGSFSLAFQANVATGKAINENTTLKIYDLTQMFGAGNEPSTVEEFYARIPQNIDLYAYNEGEIISTNAEGIKSVGFNAWDEEWESGYWDTKTGLPVTSSVWVRSKNFIPIVPNTTYYSKFNASIDGGMGNVIFYDINKNVISYQEAQRNGEFSTPKGAYFMTLYVDTPFGNSVNNIINLSDSSRNGTYEPYISREQNLDIIGKYFPNGMKSAGTAHDEIRYNKATQRWEAVKRIGEVDLGTLGWSVDGKRFSAAVLGAASAKTTAISNIICSKYNSVSPVDTYIGKTGISSNTIKSYICIADSSFTEASALRSSLQGVIAYYELAEPIVTEIEEDINLDYEVWNGGTEQAIADTPSTPFSAVIEYDFNANETIRQNKADINKIKRALQELKFDFMLPVTYSELVEMRDRGELVAGMQYRITDYVTTTIQASMQSAGHAFDVIVMATDSQTLSEEARAIVHEGDTYFTEAGANLAAWKVWYALDNDSARFAWADAENGKGVIYRLIDEWNNDCPYDFKNIQYILNSTFEYSLYGVSHTYTITDKIVTLDGVNYYGYRRTRTESGPPPPPEELYSTEEIPTTSMILYQIAAQVATAYEGGTIASVDTRQKEMKYTFHAETGDASVFNGLNCYSNSIAPLMDGGTYALNMIRFESTSPLICYNNRIAPNCANIVCSQNVHDNIIGSSCVDIVVADNSSFNVIWPGLKNANAKLIFGTDALICTDVSGVKRRVNIGQLSANVDSLLQA